MWEDPIVEEVRRHREEHAERFGYDLAAICRDLRRQQSESGRKVVAFSARRTSEAWPVAVVAPARPSPA
jgi:hypothetical protein